jgi:UDP-N-acetylglucosamine 2-epimerase
MKITIVAGARPNFIKIAPIIKAIEKKQTEGANVSYRLVHTGQHYDKNLSDAFEIEYVRQTELNLEQIQKIETAIALYLEKGLIFTFVRKEKLERSKSGKLKPFKSMM